MSKSNGKPPQEKRITLFSAVLIALALLTLLAMLFILRNTARRAQRVNEMESAREESVLTINDLSDASDYLTAEIWAYATDGNLLHISNYWNEVEITRTRDKAIERLFHSDLTAQERTHVLRAKAYSDALIVGEAWSMRLLAESYGVPEGKMPPRLRSVELTAAEEALSAGEKLQRAQRYLFGADYAASKRNIRGMVSAFNADLSARLAASTADALDSNRTVGTYSVAAVVAMMLLMAGLICVYSRMADRKNRQLTAALEDARAASSAKSYFTSRMSHEMRTPLNAVLGYLHIAQTDSDPARRESYLEKSRLAATSLLGIVNDVLDLAAIESGKMQFAREPYSVSGLLKEAGTVYAGMADSRSVRLSVSVGDLCSDAVVGDKMRVNQVLANLLSNALKFTPAGGAVELTADQKETDGALETTYVVRDTGIGMSPDFLPHIFDAYEQESAAIHGRYGGTGLGMSIVKNLVDRMGGTIAIESEKGVGSVFSVTLRDPAAAAPPAPPHTEPVCEEGSLRGMRLLVAEDNEMNIEIVRLILTRAGAEVTEARDGVQAVQTFLASPPGTFDAVLMDIIMPRMDGYAATRSIRAAPRSDAAVPIIAMSANAFASDVAQALEAGMSAHTAKPIDVQKLIATLHFFCRPEKPDAETPAPDAPER